MDQDSPYRCKEKVIAKPPPQFKPKKVSAEEPESIRFSIFANLDEVPMLYGAGFEKSDSLELPEPEKIMEAP